MPNVNPQPNVNIEAIQLHCSLHPYRYPILNRCLGAMSILLGVSATSASSVADLGVETKLGGAIFLAFRTLCLVILLFPFFYTAFRIFRGSSTESTDILL